MPRTIFFPISWIPRRKRLSLIIIVRSSSNSVFVDIRFHNWKTPRSEIRRLFVIDALTQLPWPIYAFTWYYASVCVANRRCESIASKWNRIGRVTFDTTGRRKRKGAVEGRGAVFHGCRFAETSENHVSLICFHRQCFQTNGYIHTRSLFRRITVGFRSPRGIHSILLPVSPLLPSSILNHIMKTHKCTIMRMKYS